MVLILAANMLVLKQFGLQQRLPIHFHLYLYVMIIIELLLRLRVASTNLILVHKINFPGVLDAYLAALSNAVNLAVYIEQLIRCFQFIDMLYTLVVWTHL